MFLLNFHIPRLFPDMDLCFAIFPVFCVYWGPGPVQAAGYPLKLYFQIPCVFPVQSQIFPVPIYIICDYYIDETDLADLSSSWKKMDFFASIIAVSFTFRIREFTTCANQIPCVFPVLRQHSLSFPCVLAKFPNSLCFP